ncbi:ADOP family duplicated permease [Rhodanobacter ginsengiterrae]|uniref:ADOP family duplicated permease n=1 Tax=Rhodanobacter ginsengiterrae TaxID=2008451 RepID=UPI003CE8293D
MNIWLSEIWRAWRASLRRPGFLLLATGVLALGIGASVAVATLIANTLWRPLPVPQPAQLVVFGQLHDNGHPGGISPHEYQYLDKLDGVTSLGLERPGSTVNVAGAGAPAQVPVIYIDRNMLPTLGLQPVLGRNFDVQEDRPNGPAVVILGHGFWQRSYAGDIHVIGRSLRVEGVPRTIVGVLPAGFNTVLGAGDVVLPTALPPASRDYNHNGTVAIARLAPGADLTAVSAQVDARERAMYRDMAMGGNWQKPRFGAEGLASTVQQDARPMLLLFLASALLVLLIALVNLTNLMLLRALSRNHDAAVRSALGASLPRLMLPALGEGLLVGGVGALLGMAFAVLGLALLQGFIPAEWLWGGQLHIGAAAWASAFGVGLLGALLAAVLALWRSRSATSVDELREGGRSGIGLHSGRLGRLLVVAQVALAAVLLCAAGVFMRGLYDASQLRLGFADDHVLTFELAPVKADYPDVAAINVLSQRLVQRLLAIPGVTDAAVTTNLPASNDLYGQLQTNPRTPDGKEFVAQYHGIGPGFLKLFSIPLREGRDFKPADTAGSERVVLVSQDLADTYYGGHAVGKMIDVPREGGGAWSLRIVGVVGATWQRGPLQPLQPVLYIPLAQMPEPSMTIIREMEPLRFALLGHGNPLDWQTGVREALTEVAPQQPIANLRDMRGIVRQTTQNARLSLWLIGLFAALALLLAAAGLYAVMAVAVAAREREFGVRSALGAAPRRLLGLVLRGGLFQIVAGLAIGVAVALGAAHAVAALLMTLLGRSNAFDPMVMLGVCAVLAAAGLLACLLPALRAGRTHPMRALRGE